MRCEVESKATQPAAPPRIVESDLRGWRLIARFCGILEGVADSVPRGRREEHGLRKLDAPRYLGLFLLGLFNPVLTAMRGLCEAGDLERVGREISGGKVALSRFSEAQHVFNPELLRRVFEELLAERLRQSGLGRGGGHKDGVDPALLRIVDSTLWKVVPRMEWAQWRFQGVGQQAVRLHVKLCVGDGEGAGAEGAHPASALVTHGKGCERAALRAKMQPGEIYLGDRYFGEDYAMLETLADAGCGFLFRLRNNAVVRWEKEDAPGDAPPGAAARGAGIVRDAMARLGARPQGRAWRILRIEPPGREPVLLAASECFEKMSACEVAELYRKRWQVEGFFRWLKCLAPCRHWFAESERGVNLQIYLSLICALLLAGATGRLPGKRTMELLHWHQMGWASEEELAAGIARHAREAARKQQLAEAKKRAAKKQD